MIKPFSSIPGPKAWPLVGSLYQYTFLAKKYDFKKLHRNGMKKYQEFGPVVKETIAGHTLVWIFDPEDVKRLRDSEGKYPSRRSHLALDHYRRSKPGLFKNGGLLPTNGPEWSRLRSCAQKPLTFKNLQESHFEPISKVADDFTNFLKVKHEADDILEELKKYFLEVTGVVLFGCRLGAIKEDLDSNSDAYQLMKAAMETNSHILRTDNSFQLWRYFWSSDYSKIKKSQDVIAKIGLKYIKQCIDENSLVFSYKNSSELDDRDIVTLVSDFLLAGIDTSANTMTFLLHEVAKNVVVQEDLFKETSNHSELTPETLSQCKFSRAVIMENFRLHPISVGIGRTTATATVFSGFHVPAGTCVVTQSQVSSQLEAFCPHNPTKFDPNRFSTSEATEKLHPFLSRPFGFGPRMCLGRGLADLSIKILLVKLSRAFHIENFGKSDIDCESFLINQPESPVKLKFITR